MLHELREAMTVEEEVTFTTWEFVEPPAFIHPPVHVNW
jgi:hypothetical protein